MSTNQVLTKEEVTKAQELWGAGIVQIGTDFTADKNYTQTAIDHIDNLYAYDQSPVLFKPTKAAEEQFRGDKESALSYFVATNGKCKEDKGFAIKPWTKVRFENTGMILEDNRAIAMGNYFFTDLDGNEAKVEYTFGYKLSNGALKIDVHHSSFPYNP